MAQSNLRQQFLRAILSCAKFGEAKHQYKKGTEGGGSGYMPKTPWIFSDNHKEGLKSFSSQFADFMKTSFPEIKLVMHIRAKHWNKFFKVKAITCSTQTLGTYQSYVYKLELCIVQHFNLKRSLGWSKGLVVPDSIKTPTGELLRVQQMSPRDYEKILKYAQRDRAWSKVPIAIELSKRFGLRVEECADICAKNVYLQKEGAWGFGCIDIYGKGKHHRDIDVLLQDDREFLVRVTEGLKPDDKIVGILKDSINRHLYNIMNALRIKHKYPETATHSIRKLYSQNLFRFLIEEKKFTEKEAMEKTNNQLGHSDDRDEDLLAVYVKDVKRKREREKKKRQENKRT